ncbi:hypothetical protein ACVW0Y_000897 [Pseudomonas sp. TE3786]
MSPLVITLLIVAGIVVLFLIGYINHMVENNKLEKARLKADLADRIRRCTDVSESLPGQFMAPALKLLLSRLMLQFAERLLAVDKSQNSVKGRVEELRSLVAQGDAIPVRNQPQLISNEAKAKEVRLTLETLHGLITRAAQENHLPQGEAKQWLQEVRHILVQLHIELFTNAGQNALQQGQPGHARLAFERGVQYIRKQPDAKRYQTPLSVLEKQLARANAMVLENTKPALDEANELTDGLKSMDGDDDWKKKNMYD